MPCGAGRAEHRERAQVPVLPPGRGGVFEDIRAVRDGARGCGAIAAKIVFCRWARVAFSVEW
jgi:hypothetical protein